MRIIRKESDVKKSIIVGNGFINDLPKRLRFKMIKLLQRLNKVNTIDLLNNGDAIFEFSDKSVNLSFFAKRKQKEFSKTIELLRWYLSRHWHNFSPRGSRFGEIFCAECKYVIKIEDLNNICPSQDCPSHTKWRQVIGLTYNSSKISSVL